MQDAASGKKSLHFVPRLISISSPPPHPSSYSIRSPRHTRMDMHSQISMDENVLQP